MKDYCDAASVQLLDRARHLASLIPSGLHRDVAALDVACRDRLNEIVDSLKRVRSDALLSLPQNAALRLRALRRARWDLDRLEYVAISVLHRWTDTDTKINRLADKLAREIQFPLTTPVVAGLSQNYYHTYPDLRLICIPLAEGRFLLHLSDLYHELAHSLFAFSNDARLDAFQLRWLAVNDAATKYLEGELRRAGSGFSPRAFERYIATWLQCWCEWSIEFFCDLFALYAAGPAYAWAHLHLCASSGGGACDLPLFTPSTHPPDEARMQLLLRGLRRLGFTAEAGAVEARWQELLRTRDDQQSAEYQRCFPGELLDECERLAYEAVQTLGCSLARPPLAGDGRKLLNDAWVEFWNSPDDFASWERTAADSLLSAP
jgi:hypothetical protein